VDRDDLNDADSQAKQQGHRFPSLRLEQPHSIRRVLVSAFLISDAKASSRTGDICPDDVCAEELKRLRALKKLSPE